MMVVGVGNAMADTVVLSSSTLSDANSVSDKDGVVTITDDANKGGIQTGSGTIKDVTPLKLSGSRQFKLTYSDEVIINSVKVYATNNKEETATAGTSTSDKTSYGEVAAKGAEPKEITLTGVSGEGLVFSAQSLAVIVVDYTSKNAGKEVESEVPVTITINGVSVEGASFTDGVYNYTASSCVLPPSVEISTLVTFTDGTTTSGKADVKVSMNSDATAFIASATIGKKEYQVVINAATINNTVADVTESTTWDWSKGGINTIQLTESTRITKNDSFVLSNLVPSTDAFKSDALTVSAEYPVRDSKYMQGGMVKFHTTVDGTIKVKFSNTGNRENETLSRYLYVNGTKTPFGSWSVSELTTDAIEVAAGDVELTAYIDGTEAAQYIRVFSIEFTAAGEDAGGEEGGEEGGGSGIDPSAAKLLWDYTEAAPSSTSDNGLKMEAIVNDKAGTKNGLKGIKMNSTGYAYFTKEAVEGTLKLTFGPRDGSNAIKLGVYSFASTPGAETKVVTTDGITELQTVSIDLTAEQNNIYIKRAEGAEGVLTKVEFVPFIPRTFQDFEMVLGGLSSEFDASALPSGVGFSGTYNGDAHGYRNAVVTVPVDGTVKFTYSSCTYGNQKFSVKNADGDVVASDLILTLGDDTCYHQDAKNVLTYTYTGEPTTLTFGPIQYLAYFKAEACEVSPCTITYKDQDGNILGTVDTFEGEALGEMPYGEENLTIPEGSAFRGWVYTSGVKATAADAVKGNTTITALVTPIETVEPGSVQTYDFTSNIFYPEDHETVSVSGGYYHDGQHGWAFATDGSISVEVAGNAQVVLSLCNYSKDDAINVTDAAGNAVTTIESGKVDPDGAQAVVNYTGDATTLTFTFAKGESYLHKVFVYNVTEFLEKDETTGYYIVPSGDAAALLLAINSANATGDAKIFLPNGTYDLGVATGTTISGKNISIIGESAEGVIIKNAPNVKSEGLGKADLLYNSSSDLYMQDITLQNALDYYNAGTVGRAASLHDQGKNTIAKNVRLLSYQDTYYSHKDGSYFYWEGGEIHGTVDYICGGGSAYFNRVTLVNESRSASGNSGDCTITAAQTNSADKGYVFDGCAIKTYSSTFNLGRSWGTAKTIFLNTTIESGKIVDSRFSTSVINSDPVAYYEYNTVDNSGNDRNTPSSNKLTFAKGTSMETVITETEAANYSYDNFFNAGWDPKAIAAQEIADAENIDADAIYLVEKDGEYVALLLGSDIDAETFDGCTIRKANARGGFGEPATIVAPEPTPEATDLTADMFHVWTSGSADAEIAESQEAKGCSYVVGEETDMPYGHGSVVWNQYADLSDYGTLTVTTTSGSGPRFLFNRTIDGSNDGMVIIPDNAEQTAKYQTTTENEDGSKTWVIDLAAIKADNEFVHLHAIKTIGWGSKIVVTDMKLTPAPDPEICDPVFNINDGETISSTKEITVSFPDVKYVTESDEWTAKIEYYIVKKDATVSNAQNRVPEGAAELTAEGNLCSEITLTDLNLEDGNEYEIGITNATVYDENGELYEISDLTDAPIKVSFKVDDTTDIDGITDGAVKANGKYLINGKVVIIRNGIKYNVAGASIK